MKSHISQICGIIVSTFSEFRVSAQSPFTDIYGFAKFTFSGLYISVQSLHFRAPTFHNIQILQLVQFQVSRFHNPLAFYNTHIQTLRFLSFAFLGILRVLTLQEFGFLIF